MKPSAPPFDLSRPVIPYGRQCVEEDDIEAVTKVMRSDALTQGPELAAFEKELAAEVGARFCVCVSSGTAALHIACIAAGVTDGDWGITSPITFLASANAIRYAHGAPRFADVSEDSALISPAALEKRMARVPAAPRVIVPVDFAGTPADMPAIAKIAERAGSRVIEDCAHSLGATYRDEDGAIVKAASCTHSHMAVMSFHPVKHITCGEGGAVTTNDEVLYDLLLRARNHGVVRDPAKVPRVQGEPWYYEQQSLGWNYRMNDMQAALGRSQLKKLGRFVGRRRQIAAFYNESFADLRGEFAPLSIRDGAESAYHLYVLRLARGKNETLASVAERRRALYLSLREDGIMTQVHYIPVPRQPDFMARGFSDYVPHADAYYAGALSLPIYPAMSDSDVERVASAVRARVAIARAA